MQTKEIMKKLADNYETLELISRRCPSSMSRLKNLLMSEGVSETSARRKIADLDTEVGCLVIEGYGSLKLNQNILSQMFGQIQDELKIPNCLEAEYKQQLVLLKGKIGSLEKQESDEISRLKSKLESKDVAIESLRNELEKEKKANAWNNRFDRERYLEASGKLELAEEKIARMKKGIFDYIKVCREDRRNARWEERRIKREAKARRKQYAELERKWEKKRKKRGY